MTSVTDSVYCVEKETKIKPAPQHWATGTRRSLSVFSKKWLKYWINNQRRWFISCLSANQQIILLNSKKYEAQGDVFRCRVLSTERNWKSDTFKVTPSFLLEQYQSDVNTAAETTPVCPEFKSMLNWNKKLQFLSRCYIRNITGILVF